MQPELQHVDPHADPHDVIAAQLRNLAPHIAHATSQADVTPVASPEQVSEPLTHAAPLNDNAGELRDLSPRNGLARGVAGLIVCAGIAAAAAWHSYGDEAKQRLSHLVPQLAGATAPTQNADAAESPAATSQVTTPQPAAEPASVQDTAATAPATPPEPESPPSTATAETSPTQAAVTPELAQSIATMASEIASLKQTVEQLQAGQQQLSRDVAKVTDETRRKPVAQASKPVPPPRPQRAASTPAPVTRSIQPASPQAYPHAQAYPQGQTYPQSAAQREAYVPSAPPTQLPPQPGDTSVPRPPMPLR